MNPRRAALLFVGLVCGIGCLAIETNGLEIMDLDNIKEKEMAEVQSMAKLYEDIDKNLPASGSDEEIFASARKARDGKTLFQLKEKSAFDLFIALEDAAKSCDMKSYKILAMNKIISDQSTEMMVTIRNVVNRCRQVHAKTCFNEYVNKFNEARNDLDKFAKLYVEHEFKYVTVDDIRTRPVNGDANQAASLPMQIQIIREPNISMENYRNIAQAVAHILEDLDLWYKYQIYLDDTGVAHTPAFGLKLIDKVLISPCTKYFNHFQAILEPAGFDATLDDEAVLKVLLDNPEFAKAIAYLRLCKCTALRDETKAIRMLQKGLSLISEREFTSKWPLFGLTNQLA